MVMVCPSLKSQRNQQAFEKRISRATAALGEGTVTRILAFASYLLGWPQKDVARSFNYSVPGLKSLVQQVLSQGVERFVDQRRKDAWHLPDVEHHAVAPKPAVVTEKRDEVIVRLESASLIIDREDALARKILAMILVDSGVMTQKAAAEIMGTKPLAASKNYQRFKAEGAAGLVDKRTGQKQDYKFDSQVKGELIYGYSMNILHSKRPSGALLARYLSDVFGVPFSRRSVSYHLNQMGLNQVGPRLLGDTQRFIQEELLKKGLQN